MIAYLKGQLIHKSPEHAVVDVNGVGYKVFTPLSTYYSLPKPGEPVSLRIHTRVREDELKLFGFLTEEEQTILEKLITINKVGPKLALGILSGMSPADLLKAITNNDAARLSAIPGVGKKNRRAFGFGNERQTIRPGIGDGASTRFFVSRRFLRRCIVCPC